ncbi:MAG: ATP-binding protein, partial [Pseudomonadota bacterium]
SSEGIWDWDVSRGQVYWSARNRQMLGYEAAQFVDTLEALRDRVHPEDLAGLDGALERHLTKGEPFEHVYRIRAAHGGWHWWQTRGNTTRDPMGRPLRILGINRDITEEKAREAELEEARIAAQSASEAKSRFLAHMSHEIRTPMNGIIGMADLLGEGMLDPDQRTAVETIVSSGETLMAIIDDVLDFSKVEAGKIVLTDGPVDPVTEIETVAALLASGARDKGLGLILDLDLDLPPLRGDALRMRQVITNLIGNAIKFTDAGQVSISLRSVPGGPPGMIEIEVVDTGRGIAADEHASIFDAFEQASRDRSSEPTMNSRLAGTAGTGLGLAICRSLCEIMGGSIDVDSIPGQGASFRARFGLSVDTSAGAMPARSVPVSAVQGNAGGILVLSPLEGRRRAIGALAARTGRVVATAASVQSATPSAMAQRFSLAVVDEALLGQAEREAASAALAALPGAPPVVVLRRPSVRSKAIELPGLTVASLLDEPVRPRQVVMLLSLLASGRSRATPTARSPGSGSGAADEASLRYPEASVLVVEDNRVNRVVIGRMLERMVAKVAFAETGGAALSFIEETRPDLILMDVQLPDEDGLSVTRRIRASEAATGAKPLTIVALTANAMPSDKDAAAAAGMNDFLAKPVRLQALADCIDRWLFPESEDQSERAGRAGGE